MSTEPEQAKRREAEEAADAPDRRPLEPDPERGQGPWKG